MKSDYSGSTTTIQYNNGVNHRLHHHHPSDTDTTLIESTARCQSQANGMSMFDDPRLTHKVNLAAAFHDHISCTKLPSQICKVGGDINSLIGASLSNCSTLDTANSLLFGAAAASSTEDKIQIQKLKDMILMQLDLIQHQQEQLLKKDRQLQGLKHDREALCLRLEKMENRITFLTKKLLEVNSDNNSNASVSNQLEATNDSIQSSDDSEKMPVIMGDNSDVSNVLNKMYSSSNSNSSPSTSRTGVKKCSKPVDQSPLTTSCTGSRGDEDDDTNNTNQTQLIEVEISDSNGPIGIDLIMVEDIKSEEKLETKPSVAKSPKKPCKRRRNSKSTDQQASISNSNSSTKAENEESCNGELPCEPIKRRRMSKNGNRKCDHLSEPVNNCKQMSTNFNVLETDEPYDLYNCRQEMNLPQRVASLPCDIPVKAKQIEVPSWRINHIPNTTSSEVAENLDDEVYLRRHAKLEVDERRRKRWDIQRLREQKHNEKLRSGRYNHTTCLFDKAPSSPKKRSVIDLVSFFPDPKDVQFIEVSDKLPVMAFGLPIPSLPPKPFSLPWLKSSRQSKKS